MRGRKISNKGKKFNSVGYTTYARIKETLLLEGKKEEAEQLTLFRVEEEIEKISIDYIFSKLKKGNFHSHAYHRVLENLYPQLCI